MKIIFEPTVMNAIQFNNNYEEVIEWVKKHCGGLCNPEFNLNQNDPEFPCMEIKLDYNYVKKMYSELHIVDRYDYLVWLPEGRLSLYSETNFKRIFRIVG